MLRLLRRIIPLKYKQMIKDCLVRATPARIKQSVGGYARRVVPLRYKQRIKDYVSARRQPGTMLPRHRVSTDAEVRQAIQIDLLASVEWLRQRVIEQEAEIRHLRDDLDEATAQLKEAGDHGRV